MLEKDEWTQEEFLKNKKLLEKDGLRVVLVDTILKPFKGIESITYNPYEMQKFPKGSVFVFYCDTGKTTKERLKFYKEKLPEYKCISLKGGRAYWRPNFQLRDENE